MRPPVTPGGVLHRALRLLLGTCGLIGLLIGAGLIHLYTIVPPCRLQTWRMPERVSCNRMLWFFGPTPLEALAYLAGGVVVCLLLAWVTLWRSHRGGRRRR